MHCKRHFTIFRFELESSIKLSQICSWRPTKCFYVQMINILLFLWPMELFLCTKSAGLFSNWKFVIIVCFSLICRSAISEESVAPFCSYRAHTKAIADIAFSCFDSLFMVSCGLDHRLVLYNLQSEEDPKQELLKINFDVELTACALSLSDTVLFVGTKTGRLVKLSLFQTVNLTLFTHLFLIQF